MSHTTNTKVTRDETRWEVEVSAEIPAESLAAHRSHTISELTSRVTIPGFRPGYATESAILKHFGEQAILQETAEHAVRHELPELLAKESVNIVDAPKVSIESPVPGQPVKFVARAPLAPEIRLADYKKIAAKINKTKELQEITDVEHTAALIHLRRERARIEHIETGLEPEKAAEEVKKIADAELPPLDDAFVQSLGYSDAANFTAEIRTNMLKEKENRDLEKRRATLLQELVKGSTIKYPAMLKDFELDDMEARMAGDLERMGSTIEKYLVQTKKSRAEIRTEWDASADERAKVRLVLAEIARKETIDADAERLASEVKHAKEHYKDADESALRAHIQHSLRNEAVINWLESQS